MHILFITCIVFIYILTIAQEANKNKIEIKRNDPPVSHEQTLPEILLRAIKFCEDTRFIRKPLSHLLFISSRVNGSTFRRKDKIGTKEVAEREKG